MAKLSKRRKAIIELCREDKQYTPDEAFTLLKQCPQAKFSESVDVSVKLGIDARKSDQVVRGASNLPHGLGKAVKVAVFTQGELVDAAQQTGADEVGLDDLVKKVEAGNFDWDVVIASPDAMPSIGKIGQILGPRGLMPNPKDGTVTPDLANAVRSVKTGRARYRTDKAGIIHCSIGRLDFDNDKLKENLIALLANIWDSKPASAKGTYMKKLVVSSTMGPGLKIDQSVLQN